MEPLVSIIMPVHNAGPYLRESLESIFAQTYSHYEVICVDDGSTDGSSEILREYAAVHEAFTVISSETAQGPSRARNAGLDRAKGEYIAFLDGDDWWDRRALERSVSVAEDSNADIVVFDYWLFFNSTGDLGTYRDEGLFERLNGGVYNLQTCPELAGFVGVWDRLFRRSLIESKSFRFPNDMLYEDAVFCFDTLIEAGSIAVISDHLYYYRRDVEQSITARESDERGHKEDFLAAHSYMQSRLRESGASLDVWKNYTWYFMEYAHMHQRQASPYPFFKAFFGCVYDMTLPDAACGDQGGKPGLIALGQGGLNPERSVYRKLLADNHPAGEYFYLKTMNQFRRVARGVYWNARKMRGRRHGR